MNKRKFLAKPPWSGNEVSTFVRGLGLLYAVFIIVVLVSAPYFLVNREILWLENKNLSAWEVAGFIFFSLPLNLYLMIMMFYIGKHGKAPVSWVPWK